MDFRAVDFLDFTFRLCLCRSVENLLLTSSLAFARLHSPENPLSMTVNMQRHSEPKGEESVNILSP